MQDNNYIINSNNHGSQFVSTMWWRARVLRNVKYRICVACLSLRVSSCLFFSFIFFFFFFSFCFFLFFSCDLLRVVQLRAYALSRRLPLYRARALARARSSIRNSVYACMHVTVSIPCNLCIPFLRVCTYLSPSVRVKCVPVWVFSRVVCVDVCRSASPRALIIHERAQYLYSTENLHHRLKYIVWSP